jgi:hypothetical protein
MRKALRYAAATVLGLFVVFLAAIGILNAFDETLNPEVLALVQRVETDQIAKDGNAYFFIRGLHAPLGRDIELAGKSLDEADRHEVAALRAGDKRKVLTPPAPPGTLKFEGDSWNLCTVTQDYLYERGVCKFAAETDRMFHDNSELLRRYYRLLEYRVYEEPALVPPRPDPDLVGLMRLANVDMEREIDQGRLDEAARQMVRNLAFWRNALAGKYRLISEALMRVNYSYSLITLSELLWRHPKLIDRADFRTALAEPMQPNPASLRAQMDREFMSFYFVQRGADLLLFEGSGRSNSLVLKWVADHLYRRNATLNAYYTCFQKYYSVRASSGMEYEQAVAQYQNYDIEVGPGDLFVNLTGKLALSEQCPMQHWFNISRGNILEARRRLVLLEMRLLDSKLPPERYPALLQSADAGLRDPVTQAPAKWDAQRRIIYFEHEKGCFSEGHWVALGPAQDFNPCRS